MEAADRTKMLSAVAFACATAIVVASALLYLYNIFKWADYPEFGFGFRSATGAALGKKITTIEGLAANGVLNKVQQAWLDHDVPQCGYCQPGIIMAVTALLNEKPKPTDADIDEAMTNLCRCGTYARVRKAIHAAASPVAAVTPKRA